MDENELSTVLRILDWRVPGDGVWIQVIVEALSETRCATHRSNPIISTTLAQLIEAIDIVRWADQQEEVRAEELFENLETAPDMLKDRLGYGENDTE